ncbi:uncharacterized protein TNCV_2594111 [Trichonephila clavipes]|nr:uncharacterized protein TNCV_2594111 [Trichonephila clavipes]
MSSKGVEKCLFFTGITSPASQPAHTGDISLLRVEKYVDPSQIGLLADHVVLCCSDTNISKMESQLNRLLSMPQSLQSTSSRLIGIFTTTLVTFERITIVRVQYFVRGGFVGHRSRASSKHLFSHLPVDGVRFLGGQNRVALQLKDARVGVGSNKDADHSRCSEK